jgi:uncharacterized membrane protein SpoIIM required for sporulation
MAEINLSEQRRSWQELETLLASVDSRSLSGLTAVEVRKLRQLYRTASADLLLATDQGSRSDIIDYLEALVGRAYTTIHAPKKLDWRRGWRYFSHDWPTAARAEKTYLFLAGATIGLGFLLAWLLCLASPEAFDHLMPAEVVTGYGERPDDYRAERFGDLSEGEAAQFSAFLMTNNIRVAIKSFAYGLTAGIGTAAVLFFNGAMLGAIAANFLSWNMSLPFWALILPHGVVELFAIALGGGGGYILADAILRPGRRSRLSALRMRARDALRLSAMAAPMLVFAALVEAFVTPAEAVPDAAKLAIAALILAALVLYVRAPWIPAAHR